MAVAVESSLLTRPFASKIRVGCSLCSGFCYCRARAQQQSLPSLLFLIFLFAIPQSRDEPLESSASESSNLKVNAYVRHRIDKNTISVRRFFFSELPSLTISKERVRSQLFLKLHSGIKMQFDIKNIQENDQKCIRFVCTNVSDIQNTSNRMNFGNIWNYGY